jgi:DNA-binding GntR family transcriptional regulator
MTRVSEQGSAAGRRKARTGAAAKTRRAGARTMAGELRPIARDNLSTRVYAELRIGLMEGRFWPGDRFKIRELAAAFDVSETPVREAVMQLVRERGLAMDAGRSITVARLSLAQYLELRTIRLQLEGLAAELATTLIPDTEIRRLGEINKALSAAEKAGDWRAAVRTNWQFHHTLYQAAGMPELLALIEGMWLRNGPLLNLQYPHARPTYPGRHQHLNVLDALRRRQPDAVRDAIKADMIEGGAGLVTLLETLERDGESARRDR